MAEMLSSGLRAVLVKVSGGGLDPVKHVGKDLGALQPAFHRLEERFGLDICGEGGEYESLVLDCPLFSRRIELTEASVVVDRDDPSVGYLCITKYTTVPRESAEGQGQGKGQGEMEGLSSGCLPAPPAATPPPAPAADTDASIVAGGDKNGDRDGDRGGDEDRGGFSAPAPRLQLGLDGLGATGLLFPSPESGPAPGAERQGKQAWLFSLLFVHSLLILC
jgi:hypothetical protein